MLLQECRVSQADHSSLRVLPSFMTATASDPRRYNSEVRRPIPAFPQLCDVLQVQKEPREVQAERRAQQEEAERARRKQQQDKNESKAKMKVRSAGAEGIVKLGVRSTGTCCLLRATEILAALPVASGEANGSLRTSESMKAGCAKFQGQLADVCGTHPVRVVTKQTKGRS